MKLDDLEVLDLNEEENALTEENVKARSRKSRAKRNKKEAEDKEVDWKQEVKSWIVTFGVTIAVVFVIKNFIIINASVPTGSMENTIMPGDNILGFRLAYLMEEPKRGDVIFFYFPDDESQKYVKRIIGLPGEKVFISGGNIYINDATIPLEENYLKEEWMIGAGPFEFEVPDGCYLVLGDNRNSSQDARYWMNPYLTKEKIIGKAIFTYFPFDRMGLVE